jgi:hypothetical protein
VRSAICNLKAEIRNLKSEITEICNLKSENYQIRSEAIVKTKKAKIRSELQSRDSKTAEKAR